jgi:RimJ/RimL family protein N-acetyltransferase
MRTATRLPSVETPSLILREIELDDVDSFANFMLQATYQRFIAVRMASTNDIRAFVTRAVARQGDPQRQVFNIAAEEKLSCEVIGDGFLIRERPKAVEIGWGLHPAMWRMGLGREIGSALLAIAFERLQAATAWCKVMRENTSSARLARHLGLELVKTHPDYQVRSGFRTTVDVYSIGAAAYFEQGY